MRRENRRVAAMSWGNGDDIAPPKPSRGPIDGKYNRKFRCNCKQFIFDLFIDSQMILSYDGDVHVSPQTYIVAQNPTVLAQLMRENESRPLNPSAYTTPASVFNTLAVDIDAEKAEPEKINKPVLPLKTIIIPAVEMLKLDPFVDQNLIVGNSTANDDNNINRIGSIDKINFPNDNPLDQSATPLYPIPCEQISIHPQQFHYVDIDPENPNNSNMIEQLEIFSQASNQFQFIVNAQQNSMNNVQYNTINQHVIKYGNLDGNCSINMSCASRMSSLERAQSSTLRQNRSNSLTRQFSAGNGSDALFLRAGSLERSPRAVYNRANSLERKCQQLPDEKILTSNNRKGGSLERNQSPAIQYDLMRTHNFCGGSLDRNYSAYPMVNRSASLERNTKYQVYRDHMKQQQIKQKTPESEPFQEEIYDFGGANVKSCASIALSKSISKGLLPAGTQLPQTNTFQTMNLVSSNPNYSGLPPPHHLVQSSSNALPPVNHSNFQQNSIYTPMYPRPWNKVAYSTSIAANSVCAQKPPINSQKVVFPSFEEVNHASVDSEPTKITKSNESNAFVTRGDVAQVRLQKQSFCLL